MSKKPKPRVVEGKIQPFDLDDILNRGLLSRELTQIMTMVADQGIDSPEIEAEALLVQKFLKSGDRAAASNALYELRRLYAIASTPIWKPVVTTGLKFKGRGKAPLEGN